jgi:preprotein translocase subunit SecY
VRPSFGAVIAQIVVLDNSVVTAVGIADEITISVTAVILAVGVIVDAEHNLKERQRDERDQTGGGEECVHGAALPCSLN